MGVIIRFITGTGRPFELRKKWIQGWHEIPEVMFSCCAAVVGKWIRSISGAGIGFAIAGVRRYIKEDGYHRRYKGRYVVYRPDNPNIAHIKHDLGPYIKPEY